MEQHDDAARGRTDWDLIRALQVETARALEAAPGPLRELRVHCLREKSQVLLAALEQPPSATQGPIDATD